MRSRLEVLWGDACVYYCQLILFYIKLVVTKPHVSRGLCAPVPGGMWKLSLNVLCAGVHKGICGPGLVRVLGSGCWWPKHLGKKTL